MTEAAFLVGPIDETHCHGWLAFGSDAAKALQSGKQVQAAVEPAPVRHRVDVAADEYGSLRLPLERRPLIAALVDFDLDRKLLELLSHPGAGLGPDGCPGDPLGSVLVGRELA